MVQNYWDFDSILPEKLRKSILNRVCETSTGYLKVPSDLIKRVRNELSSTESNTIINASIQEYVNSKTS